MVKKIETGDKTFKNSPKSKSKKTVDLKIPEVQSDTIIKKQKTENMETHAYHLHKAPGTKIWHYFFEFLMLFLAVFCGFIAENWREELR